MRIIITLLLSAFVTSVAAQSHEHRHYRHHHHPVAHHGLVLPPITEPKVTPFEWLFLEDVAEKLRPVKTPHFTPPKPPKPLPPKVDVEKKAPAKTGFAGHMLGLISTVLHHMSINSYRLGGSDFDMNRGIYHVDCSEYVDTLIRRADPNAYSTLVRATQDRPTSVDYFTFFESIPLGQTRHGWYRVPRLSEARGGDILVFRYKNLDAHRTGGHVMVIVDAPQKSYWAQGAYKVRISDSAPSGHSEDTRSRHTSGIGIGSILLKADPHTDLPYAYAWNWYAHWEYDMDYVIARFVQ